MTVTIYQGDAISVLQTLPSDSVHCAVTSPPYYGLRDYKTKPLVWDDGWKGQLGLEPTPELYVHHLVLIFRELRRVLRPDATFWLNIGDSYNHDTKWGGSSGNKNELKQGYARKRSKERSSGCKPKDLLGIPWMLAFALRADGWWLRSNIIFSKLNPMPESVTDRPTCSHEYIFLLAKSARYFFDMEAVREPMAPETALRLRQNNLNNQTGSSKTELYQANHPGRKQRDRRPTDILRTMRDDPQTGRNLRSVWTIPTQGFRDAHFAVFPKKLILPCIKAGTSERGCCPKCGAPWVRVLHKDRVATRPGTASKVQGDREVEGNRDPQRHVTTTRTAGWMPSCTCYIRRRRTTEAQGTDACTVLDPFGGSGTTGVVAAGLSRDAILIELNPEYVAMAKHRIERSMGLFSEVKIVHPRKRLR